MTVNSPLKTDSGVVIPVDLVQVGYVSGAYGLNGWVRIKPFSSTGEALLSARVWWLDKPALRDVDVMQAKVHSGDVVAQLAGVSGRDAAEVLKGTSVQIPRSYFPALPDGEFYWVDLIGLAVENLQGESIGVVHDMMDNSAHPILRVEAVVSADAEKRDEILIPFVGQFIKTVDQKAGKITVDWGLDY
ncbi:ribosome maturation factor RimM [Actimicrobium sp. CCI2.3]|uniref:ribosome maturation factor RimM n=1 Tax=Actimicrobium sp. CCI2.3 TaxID=3048616 RepID=UPI002AB5A4D1|nr:ribosome maturation factor RimM [Actimicrobium sp. CCI2.3]MDY7574010.1 ribosome maturation factor RimM [Actimicrobium sp. CCI2.3]MEB0021882.1 ribosome maturation factor RimM [Actimicrobium sp. CCI2.3]